MTESEAPTSSTPGGGGPPAPPKTPFDWLQGSLFFGGAVGGRRHSLPSEEEENLRTGGGDAAAADDDSQAIDDCTDAVLLLNGIFENLNSLLREEGEEVREDSPANAIENAAETTTPIEPFVASAVPLESSSTMAATVASLDRIARRLARLRLLLYEERRSTSQQHTDARPRGAPVVAEATVQGLVLRTPTLMPLLLEHMPRLPFESRKHVAAIFNYLLVCGLEGADAAFYQSAMSHYLKYIHAHYERIMTTIVQGHNLSRSGITPDIGLHFGSMYRSCTRHPSLYHQLVGTKERAARFVFPFLDTYVHVTNFEISSDAMESLRAAFAVPSALAPPDSAAVQELAADFLLRDYTEIWDERFTPKLLHASSNYMSRRMALQILSTVLLTRSNYAVMIRYVASRANLIVLMQLLRDTSPHITLDAFHVFKVFVANPNKPPEIIKILQDNKVKLCAYLTTLHQEKEETDTQFRDEKALVISTIEGL